MKEQLEQRLKELKEEFNTGQKTLADLEIKQADLKSTLLRISGAIQVLEEELSKCNGGDSEPIHYSGLKTVEMMEPVKNDEGLV